MRYDLLAGTGEVAIPTQKRVPTILIFDSGLGGLTVFAEVLKVRPDARFVYAADDAGFPYGRLGEAELVNRVVSVMTTLIGKYQPDLVVIACNTASTLVMPHLRQRFAVPFIGTVPAIKPAATITKSGQITVLATPGTVARDYTQDLIASYASQCVVQLVGSTRLAEYAEAELKGQPVSDIALINEMAPCFVENGGQRTDVIVLGCTHYPLLLDRMRLLAPWTVTWIDPAPAIARRVSHLIGPPLFGHEPDEEAMIVFTKGDCLETGLSQALIERGLTQSCIESIPLLIS